MVIIRQPKVVNHSNQNLKVDIVAPGWSTDMELVKKGVRQLQSWGFDVHLPKPLFEKNLFFAGSDQFRMKQLKAAIESDSDIIWCVRGGYGSLRLTDELFKLKKPKKKKVLVGYSDITTLHLFFNQVWGWPTLHAGMIDSIGRESIRKQDLIETCQLLKGEKSQFSHKIKSLNQKSALKKIEGLLRGGNLVVSQGHCGTRLQLSGRNAILVFEDIGERAYRIDRALIQLLQSGCFIDSKAIVFGDFTGGLEPSGKNLVMNELKQFSHEVKIPCFHGLEVGHGGRLRPLMFNHTAMIQQQNGAWILKAEV